MTYAVVLAAYERKNVCGLCDAVLPPFGDWTYEFDLPGKKEGTYKSECVKCGAVNISCPNLIKDLGLRKEE